LDERIVKIWILSRSTSLAISQISAVPSYGIVASLKVACRSSISRLDSDVIGGARYLSGSYGNVPKLT